jgi:hypothetical protein
VPGWVLCCIQPSVQWQQDAKSAVGMHFLQQGYADQLCATVIGPLVCGAS